MLELIEDSLEEINKTNFEEYLTETQFERVQDIVQEWTKFAWICRHGERLGGMLYTVRKPELVITGYFRTARRRDNTIPQVAALLGNFAETNGCKYIVLETARKGMIKTLLESGYKVQRVRLIKQI